MSLKKLFAYFCIWVSFRHKATYWRLTANLPRAFQGKDGPTLPAKSTPRYPLSRSFGAWEDVTRKQKEQEQTLFNDLRQGLYKGSK